MKEQSKEFSYSIALDVSGKTCLVVGAGRVAERKVKKLLASGAKVVVMAENISVDIRTLNVQIEEKPYEKGDLERIDPFLIIACTNSVAVNTAIALQCEESQRLVNVANNNVVSNFIVQSSFQREDLLVSVSTNGKSPVLSRQLREYLEHVIDERFVEVLDIMAILRAEVLSMEIPQEERANLLTTLDVLEIEDLLKEKSKKEVLERIRECLFSSLD